MARRVEELTGEFDFIQRKYPASDGQVKVLPALLVDGTQICGYCKEDELQTGVTYLFRGFWTSHERYGRQFNFHSYGITQPVGQRGTVAYLQRGPGIGRKRALQIWSLWGQDSLRKVRECPEEVAAAVAGITEERAREAAAYFTTHIDREIVTRDLEEIGLSKRQIEWAIGKWGARAAETIRKNAYILMLCRGFGFGRADKLYLELGGDPTNVERLGWSAWNALYRDREGSTWLEPSVAIKAIEKSVSGVEVIPQAGIDWAIEQGHVVKRVDEAGKMWIAEDTRAAAETRLANAVYKAMVEGEI